ncbi:hypothetical protein ES703_07165 [subsurface metagenome]
MKRLTSEEDKKDRIIQILEEIARWTRLQGRQLAKRILESVLNDEKKRLIYHLSDGRSSPEIAKIAKVDPSTVRDYWKIWTAEGFVEIHPEYKRRCRKVFSLEELGLEPPEVLTEKLMSEQQEAQEEA